MSSLSSHANFPGLKVFRPVWFFATVRRLTRAFETASRWRRTVAERRTLAALGDRALQDFGVTRADAIREAETPFWR